MSTSRAASPPLPIALVGAGGMARRYLNGLAALAGAGGGLSLAAICNRTPARAAALADEAEARLGLRPRLFDDVAAMARALPELRGAVIASDAASHLALSITALEAGLHLLVEKPLALTVRGCTAVMAAAARAGRVLSVAENYRRDPMNRLVRALIDDGAIGEPRLIVECRIGGGDELFLTPWRHQKLLGTLILDVGVHYADLLEYFLGPVASLYGEGRLFERHRRPPAAGTGATTVDWSAFYGPAGTATIEATGEDALFAYLRFASGAVGQWTFHYAAHGPQEHRRIIYGSRGTLVCPNDRSGRPPRLYRAGGEVVEDGRLLDLAPSHRLSPTAARLYGAERPWHYELAPAAADAPLLALELAEFAACIEGGLQPEVDGAAGRRAVALVNAVFESGRLGRPVTPAEVEAGVVDAYQREIDAHNGLIEVARG